MRYIMRFYGSCGHIKNEDIDAAQFADWTRHHDARPLHTVSANEEFILKAMGEPVPPPEPRNEVTTEGDAQVVHVYPFRYCVCSDCMADDVAEDSDSEGGLIPRGDFHAIMSEVDELHLYGERTRNDEAPIDSSDLTYMLGLAQGIVRLLERGLGIDVEEPAAPPQRYWLVDEDNDWEGETFGLAIPRSERVDTAMAAWRHSWIAYWRDMDRPADGLSWSMTDPDTSRDYTEEFLEAFSAGSDNTYTSRVSYPSDEAIEKLLVAIETLPRGCTLSLYKGQLSREYPEPRENTSEFIFDLWELAAHAAMNEDAGSNDDDEDTDDEEE